MRRGLPRRRKAQPSATRTGQAQAQLPSLVVLRMGRRVSPPFLKGTVRRASSERAVVAAAARPRAVPRPDVGSATGARAVVFLCLGLAFGVLALFSQDGFAAIHHATVLGLIPMVQMLLKRNSDVNCTTNVRGRADRCWLLAEWLLLKVWLSWLLRPSARKPLSCGASPHAVAR